MKLQRLMCGLYAANAYLLISQDGQRAALIDAGDDLEALLQAVKASGAALEAIVLTHGHFDHMLAAAPLRAQTGATLYIHEADAKYLSDARLNCYNAAASRLAFVPGEADQLIRTPDGAGTLSLCGIDFRVLSTPGHTPGGICLWCEAEKVLFTGDTLFADGYGRMDLPGGDPRAMARSLERLMDLPGDVTIYPGHGRIATIDAVRGGLF